MRYQILTNPNYHSDKFVDIDPQQVIAMEEKTISVLFGGKHRVTVVTLEGGRRYILRGELKAQIEAQQQSENAK